VTNTRKPGSPKKRMGRPPLPAKARKVVNFTFRGRKDLREKLGEAASHSGRSLSEEIERILEAHFASQDLVTTALGGEAASEIVKPLLFFLGQLERRGIAWRGNEEIAPLMQACISLIIEAAVAQRTIPYKEWSQRLGAAYTGNALSLTSPGPKVFSTAEMAIQGFGIGELEPD